MKLNLARTNRRIGVIVNYLCLILLLAVYYTVVCIGLNLMLIVCAVTLLVIIIFSFIIVYVKSGLWRLTHAKMDKLDEREVYTTGESLRCSYAIFSVICLAILLAEAVLEKGIVNVLLVAELIYLAHTMPSSVIAWKHKEL